MSQQDRLQAPQAGLVIDHDAKRFTGRRIVPQIHPVDLAPEGKVMAAAKINFPRRKTALLETKGQLDGARVKLVLGIQSIAAATKSCNKAAKVRAVNRL